MTLPIPSHWTAADIAAERDRVAHEFVLVIERAKVRRILVAAGHELPDESELRRVQARIHAQPTPLVRPEPQRRTA